MSCLEKVCLLNLLKGLPDRVTQAQFSVSALCSPVSLSLPFTFSCLLMLGSFSSLVLVFSRPRFRSFSDSLDLPLSRKNMVQIRHLSKTEPVFLGQMLLKTLGFHILARHIRGTLIFYCRSFDIVACQGVCMLQRKCPLVAQNIGR